MLLFAIPINIAPIYRYKYKCAWEKNNNNKKTYTHTQPKLTSSDRERKKEWKKEKLNDRKATEEPRTGIASNKIAKESIYLKEGTFFQSLIFFCTSLPCMPVKMRINFK